MEQIDPPSLAQLQLDSAVVPSVPTLPVELVRSIIQLSLPLVTFSTFRQRYDDLLRFSLVSSVWRALAEEELLKHVGLTKEETSDALLHTLSTLQRRRSLTKTLWLDEDPNAPGAIAWSATGVSLLMSKLGGVHTLRLFSSRSWVELNSLAKAGPNLEELVLGDLRVAHWRNNGELPRFRQVQRLALASPDPHVIYKLLRHASYPALRSLSIMLHSPLERAPFESGVRHLAPRLTSFALTKTDSIGGGVLSDSTWGCFTQLEHLTLIYDLDFERILSAIPSSLKQLRVTPPFAERFLFYTLQRVLKAFLLNPPSINKLEKLILPALEPCPWTQFEAIIMGERGAAQDQLADLCKARGIKVVERVWFPQDNRWAYLNDLLDPV
ncbi:hypothetical protein BCR35DRAFT_327657 [Leucosporidium creatinivorum]|uniref:F-box domain-containing protein n=1 Tax=Leucosporidium creatinivorum TaxID=106004 RepID=A0A1Y2G3K6_9BASI|nr:hypothetical protein BCR35DRAFT_327657 [Leucosporidium creatinivorum]